MNAVLEEIYATGVVRDAAGVAHPALPVGVARDTAELLHASIGLVNLERAGLHELARVIEAPSSQALPELVAAKERFDFALIDGLHLFDVRWWTSSTSTACWRTAASW